MLYCNSYLPGSHIQPPSWTQLEDTSGTCRKLPVKSGKSFNCRLSIRGYSNPDNLKSSKDGPLSAFFFLTSQEIKTLCALRI